VPAIGARALSNFRSQLVVWQLICHLGFRYLWVDALCIIQGPNGDWATESPKMAEVYGGAFLTISAAMSPHVQHGFHQTPHRNKYQKLISWNNPLYERGWALQERILSRRLLIFGNDGLYWECQGYEHRDWPLGLYNLYPEIPALSMRRLVEGCSGKDWKDIVGDYSRRSLTLQRDKLPALSGVARLYHQFTKHDFFQHRPSIAIKIYGPVVVVGVWQQKNQLLEFREARTDDCRGDGCAN
jgi:hypothetical protein